MKEIWLLLSTQDGTRVRAMAYATREAACDDLREFMRSDVNESRPDGAWDDMTVDDALDSIFDGNDDLESVGGGLWTWNGSIRSYEWRLMRLEMRR